MYKILCGGEEDEDHTTEKVTVTELGDEGNIQQPDEKKRTQEDMVTDFVMILEQMMSPRQSVTSIVSTVIGLVAIIVGSIYVFQLPDTAIEARKLITVMIIYGFYKIVALVSFVEYSDTTSALYCPQLVFYTSLIVFVLHIVLVIIRCCCCK
ncbi:unnamed protein product [Angiostrongylus costaricensis]|uniref:Receptor expression-enhancing protein n=1 Tax=Angiostrongylus costaricensis TaxID=334426 RepID=A0A0R3PW02_ANGCS|nr:unnamed protein product [Angiostrongylus costaricensis]